MKDRLTYHPDGEHVIYFDSEGHDVFSDFARVKKSISGDNVNDLCFFDVYGYMYVDVVTNLTVPNGSYRVVVKYKGDDRYCSVKFYEADGSYGCLLGNGSDAVWQQTVISTENFYGGSIAVECNGNGGEWSVTFYSY